MLGRPRPRVRFREFGGSSLNFKLLYWVSNPAQRARATHHLNSAIYKRFRTAGVEIPFPQRDVSVSVTGVPGEMFGRGGPSEQFPAGGGAWGESAPEPSDGRPDDGR